MSDQYLWDRSGKPDPEIERLERALAPLRLGARPLARQRPYWRMAAAAAVVAAAIGIGTAGRYTSWQIAGSPVRQGQVLRTGEASLRLEDNEVGRVDVAANSEIVAPGGRRLELRRGELTAFIWAPARQFVVDTPSSRAVDLGCQYTLSVGKDGDGLVKVSMGWVAFEKDGRESFIPAGAQCRTRKKSGPGIPFYQDSSPSFQTALTVWETGGPLDPVLRESTAHDALSLWHVMTRVSGRTRSDVYDRLAQLVTLPPQANREAILRADAKAIDAAWDALGLENTSWWRGWERRW